MRLKKSSYKSFTLMNFKNQGLALTLMKLIETQILYYHFDWGSSFGKRKKFSGQAMFKRGLYF